MIIPAVLMVVGVAGAFGYFWYKNKKDVESEPYQNGQDLNINISPTYYDQWWWRSRPYRYLNPPYIEYNSILHNNYRPWSRRWALLEGRTYRIGDRTFNKRFGAHDIVQRYDILGWNNYSEQRRRLHYAGDPSGFYNPPAGYGILQNNPTGNPSLGPDTHIGAIQGQ